jgi:hypothetical protein
MWLVATILDSTNYFHETILLDSAAQEKPQELLPLLQLNMKCFMC